MQVNLLDLQYITMNKNSYFVKEKRNSKEKRQRYMAEPINIEKNLPHLVQETICVKCLHRWIDVRPESVWLKDCDIPHLDFSGSKNF